MDLTGRFLHRLSSGNSYLFVLYDYDTNIILIEPLKSHQAGEIAVLFKKCLVRLAKNLVHPNFFVMDNECSSDSDYPVHEWDRLLNQCKLILNLLRNFHINPKLSSLLILHGMHNFNKAPLPPPGTKVLVHTKHNQRKS